MLWLKSLAAPATVRVRAGPLVGKKLSIVSGARFLKGRYEGGTTEAFSRCVTRDAFVLDLGAHYGYYCLLAAHLAGPDGLIWAFEPRPSNLRVLKINLNANRATNVVVWESAVSSSSGTLRFDTGHGSGTGRLAASGDLEVSATALDDLSFPRPPSFIKMDIEGAEADALQGAAKTIQAHRPRLLISTHGPEVRHRVKTILSNWGYEQRDKVWEPQEQDRPARS